MEAATSLIGEILQASTTHDNNGSSELTVTTQPGNSTSESTEIGNVWLEKVFNYPPKLGASLLIAISVVSVIFNVRIFFLSATNKKLSGVGQLYANLSFIVIVISILYNTFTVEILLPSVGLRGAALCRSQSFLRNSLTAAYPLTIIAIIYQSVTVLRDTTLKLLLWRTVLLIWFVAAICSIPSVFTVDFGKTPVIEAGKCKYHPLMGSLPASIALEVYRFLLVHFSVCSYMTYVLYMNQSRIKSLLCLMRVHNTAVRETVRRHRLVYIYSVFFIPFWMIFGLVLSIHKIMIRSGVHTTALPGWLLFYTLFHLNNMLSPAFFLYWNQDFARNHSFWKTILCFRRDTERRHTDDNQNIDTV